MLKGYPMDLYQAILNRRSVRRYRPEPLGKESLDRIDDILAHVTPLIPDNRFRVMRRDVITGEDLIAAMGGYGRILTPPHYMVPMMIGDRLPLVDLGYRMEQLAIQMVQLGISVCFIGSLNREDNVRIRFRLPSEARIGAFLIFGRAAESVTGRTINAVIRRASGGSNKLGADRIFYSGSFDQPSPPPKSLVKMIDAGRRAPTANNAQPWRFLWQDGALYLFLRRDNPRYGTQPDLHAYRYFDGGACLSNMVMAMDALNYEGDYVLLPGTRIPVPDHPRSLEPLARFVLDV